MQFALNQVISRKTQFLQRQHACGYKRKGNPFADEFKNVC